MFFNKPSGFGNFNNNQNQSGWPANSGTGFFLPNQKISKLSATLKDQSYFTIVGPGTIRSNSKYNVAITVHNAKEPCCMKITLRGPFLDVTKTLEIPPMSLQNLEFDIPNLQKGSYQIIAEGISGIIFTKSSQLNFEDSSPLIFIQTDKATYKPGDLVQFRVLFMDDYTRPVKLKESIMIALKDGEQNLLKQWKNIDLIKGVYSNKYQLSEQPVLGNWIIDVSLDGRSIGAKDFVVAKYVLPKFKVSIETAKDVAIEDDIIHITVCSRYTYGKGVKGTAVISLKPSQTIFGSHSFQFESNPFEVERTIEVNGKGLVEFKLSDDLNISNGVNNYQNLLVSVVMEEELTGNKQKTTEIIRLHQQKFLMKGIDFPNIFHIGESLCFKVAVKNIDETPVIDCQNSVKLKIQKQQRFYTSSLFGGVPKEKTSGSISSPIKEEIIELIASLDENGIATFNHCFDSNAYNYYFITCTYLESTTSIGYLQKVSEALKIPELLEINLITKSPRLKTPIHIQIQSKDEIPYFIYTIVGRGKLLKSEFIELPENTKEHTIEFTPTFDMVPKTVMSVHYIVKNELRFKEITIPIKEEFLNKINLTAPTEAKLAEDIHLEIKTAPDSFVGLLGVDQSVLLLKSGNDLGKEQIFNELSKFSKTSPKRYDESKLGEVSGMFTLTNLNLPGQSLFLPGSCTGMVFGGPPQAQAMLFGSSTFSAQSNQMGQILNTPFKKLKSQPVLQIRKEFPENWFFDDVESTKNDITSLYKKVPDTITSWIITGFSMNSELGFAITENPSTIKTFRPFFVSTNLPYSIKRGEHFSIPVIIFNYTNEDLKAEITLDNSDNEFIFTEHGDSQESRVKKIQVSANNAGSVQFPICPQIIGNITLKIKAISPLAGDAIHKKLRVEPEGITIYKNNSYYLHAEIEKLDVEKIVTLDIPKDVVPDSEFIEVSTMGNIFGSTLTNLDKLVRMPFGCGEQNMINFVPNIMVLWYLESTGELSSEIESKAKRFMEIGYQRELNYKHDDGSYSAFGKLDDSGSTWLTAYVVRSFHQAKKYIDISPNILEGGLNFLASKQASDGSFPEVGRVVDFSHMNEIGLTAFVLLAFLENEEYMEKHRQVTGRGFEYLKNNVEKTEDIYALSVALYALHQYKSNAVNDLIVKLDSIARTDRGHKWWNKTSTQDPFKRRSWQSCSHDVEITGYILMTLLDIDTSVLPIVKWLISQRNSNGGFSSTQETVVGLWALIKFAQKSKAGRPDINIEIIPSDEQAKVRKLSVNKNNALILQSVELPKQTREVKFSGKGTGTAILQISYRYNILEKENKPSFKLNSTVKPQKSTKHLNLDIFVEFLPKLEETSSNMVVMEVTLPSGYTTSTEDFKKIKEIESVKRVETKDDNTTIIVYFDSLKVSEPKCIPIEAQLTHAVTGQKPVPIVVYDYYDSQKRATDFYKVENSIDDI